MAIGKHFDEFEVGENGEDSAITITDAHIVTFAGITGDFNGLHMNDEIAKQSRFKERIAHGMLTASIGVGVLGRVLQGTVIANTGVSMKFTAPVRIGDTITPRWEVTKLVPRRNNGEVTFKLTPYNQKGEIVMDGEITLIVACKNKG
jgi:3-hydroxybutyryl-CoA dehydratase